MRDPQFVPLIAHLGSNADIWRLLPAVPGMPVLSIPALVPPAGISTGLGEHGGQEQQYRYREIIQSAE